jgi:hypothetical protein
MLNIASNRLYCLWASFMIYNLHIQGNVPQTYFLTSWLTQQSARMYTCVSLGIHQPWFQMFLSLPYVWYHQQEVKFIGHYHMSRPARKPVKSSQATNSPEKPGGPFRWCENLRRGPSKLRASHISAYSEECNLMNETGFSSLSTNAKAISNRSG